MFVVNTKESFALFFIVLVSFKEKSFQLEVIKIILSAINCSVIENIFEKLEKLHNIFYIWALIIRSSAPNNPQSACHQPCNLTSSLSPNLLLNISLNLSPILRIDLNLPHPIIIQLFIVVSIAVRHINNNTKFSFTVIHNVI